MFWSIETWIKYEHSVHDERFICSKDTHSQQLWNCYSKQKLLWSLPFDDRLFCMYGTHCLFSIINFYTSFQYIQGHKITKGTFNQGYAHTRHFCYPHTLGNHVSFPENFSFRSFPYVLTCLSRGYDIHTKLCHFSKFLLRYFLKCLCSSIF